MLTYNNNEYKNNVGKEYFHPPQCKLLRPCLGNDPLFRVSVQLLKYISLSKRSCKCFKNSRQTRTFSSADIFLQFKSLHSEDYNKVPYAHPFEVSTGDSWQDLRQNWWRKRVEILTLDQMSLTFYDILAFAHQCWFESDQW